MLIVVADDHVLVREGLVQSLKVHHPTACFIQVGNGAELISTLNSRVGVSLILLDLRMPNTQPFSILKQISSKWPSVKLVVLSASEEQSDVDKAFDNGAHGFIPKSQPTSSLLNILDQVLLGKIYVPKISITLPIIDEPASDRKVCLPDQITQRQKDVLKLLVKGKTNLNIAEELALSECTIKIHLANIYKTLNVRNRTEAVIKVSQLAS